MTLSRWFFIYYLTARFTLARSAVSCHERYPPSNPMTHQLLLHPLHHQLLSGSPSLQLSVNIHHSITQPLHSRLSVHSSMTLSPHTPTNMIISWHHSSSLGTPNLTL